MKISCVLNHTPILAAGAGHFVSPMTRNRLEPRCSHASLHQGIGSLHRCLAAPVYNAVLCTGPQRLSVALPRGNQS